MGRGPRNPAEHVGPEHLEKPAQSTEVMPDQERGKHGCFSVVRTIMQLLRWRSCASEVASTTDFLAFPPEYCVLERCEVRGRRTLAVGELPPTDRLGLQSPPIVAAAGIAQPESNQMTLPFRLRKVFEEGPCVTYYPIIEILNPTRLQVDFNSQVFVLEDLL
jgi:hypothetical protein